MPQKNTGEIPALMNKIEALYTCIAAQMMFNIIQCEVAFMTYDQLRNRADLLEVVLDEVSLFNQMGNTGGSSSSQDDQPSLFETFVLSEVKAKQD